MKFFSVTDRESDWSNRNFFSYPHFSLGQLFPAFIGFRFRTHRARISSGLRWLVQERVADTEGVQIWNPLKLARRKSMLKFMEEQSQQKQEIKLKKTGH
jgi:hypothetical protein